MLFTEDQLLIQESAKKYATEVLRPGAAQRDKAKVFPKLELKNLAQMGFMGLVMPQSFGGSDLGYVAYVLALEAIASGDGAISTILAVHNSIGGLPIYQYGTDAAKAKYLKKMCSGELLGCFALTEPEAGSDAANIQTKAKITDDGFVLNGSKQFITSGADADIAIVFAVTDKQAGKKGISAFIVPTNTDGFKVTKIENKMGQHAASCAALEFNNLFIPKENLLGEIGQGYKIALANLETGRLGIAAQALGMAGHALECAINYANERVTFGKKLIAHQTIAFRLADMATKLSAAQQLTYHVAQLKDNNIPCLQQAAMAKLFATESAIKICADAIDVLGGYGYVDDFPVERIYRDVRVCTIYEGTSDIQKMIIAKNFVA